jgi:hypothetical protein
MPGILFNVDAYCFYLDLEANVCPQFIVTQLVQRDPPGRIISVIVATAVQEGTSPPRAQTTSTLGIIIIIHCIIALTKVTLPRRLAQPQLRGCSGVPSCNSILYVASLLLYRYDKKTIRRLAKDSINYVFWKIGSIINVRKIKKKQQKFDF